MPSFTLGQPEADHITVHIEEEDSPYRPMLKADIEVQAGGCKARFDGFLGGFDNPNGWLIDDLSRFTSDLQSIYTTLSGTSAFHILRKQLVFEITSDRLGHLKLTGTALDSPHDGSNQLNFSFDLDQTFLPSTIRELEDLTSQIRLYQDKINSPAKFRK